MQTQGRLGALICCLALASAGLFGQDRPASGPTPVAIPGADAIPQAVDSKTYEIGPGDVLRIRVYQDASLSQETVVLPDGKFSMFLIGSVQAAGLTPERLEAQLEQALMEVINMPDVQVSVLQVNSKSYRITGSVLRAGLFPLVKPITIFQALSDAQFQEYAKKKDILVIRGSERLKFNYEDHLKNKNMDKNKNFEIQNDDIIVVHD
jgi:polysaccharide export outer membrane protein